MTKERRLGRGLEALLGRSFNYEETPAVEAGAAERPQAESAPAWTPSTTHFTPHAVEPAPSEITRSDDGQQWLPHGSIDRNPYQPRTAFDEAELADLCDSIRAHGFLQPLVVRPAGSRYELIAGERRLRAAQMAGWERVPVLVRACDDRQMAELAIVENVQRKDLNAIEKAASFQRYLDQYGCTQEELATRVNIDRSTVANLIRLLELPEEVKQMIARSELTAGHARALLPLGDAEEQVEFARRIHRDALSVRATEQAVSDHIAHVDGAPLSIVDAEGNSRPSPLQPGQHLRDLAEQFRMALGVKVDVKQTAKGRGRITIHFGSHEEFDRLRDQLLAPRASDAEAM